MENVDVNLFKAIYLIAMVAVVYAFLLRPVYKKKSSNEAKLLMEVCAIGMTALSIGGNAGLLWTGLGIPSMCAIIVWKLHKAGVLAEIQAQVKRPNKSK